MSRNESRIYVGNLPPDIRTKDIEDLFYKFGNIAFIDLKNRKGPPFAFVEFEDPRLVPRLFMYSVCFSAISSTLGGSLYFSKIVFWLIICLGIFG